MEGWEVGKEGGKESGENCMTSRFKWCKNKYLRDKNSTFSAGEWLKCTINQFNLELNHLKNLVIEMHNILISLSLIIVHCGQNDDFLVGQEMGEPLGVPLKLLFRGINVSAKDYHIYYLSSNPHNIWTRIQVSFSFLSKCLSKRLRNLFICQTN